MAHHMRVCVWLAQPCIIRSQANGMANTLWSVCLDTMIAVLHGSRGGWVDEGGVQARRSNTHGTHNVLARHAVTASGHWAWRRALRASALYVTRRHP